MNDTPETIYLIPGEDGIVWCDDPAPDEHCDPAEAVKYVRADVLEQAEAKIALLDERFHELEQGGGTLQPLREAFTSNGAAWLLRKQAEAISEAAADFADEWPEHDVPRRWFEVRAETLSLDADEAERAGGEK